MDQTQITNPAEVTTPSVDNDLQKAIVETNIDDFMADDTKEYFVVYTDTKYSDTPQYKVVFQNDAGAILKKSK